MTIFKIVFIFYRYHASMINKNRKTKDRSLFENDLNIIANKKNRTQKNYCLDYTIKLNE